MPCTGDDVGRIALRGVVGVVGDGSACGKGGGPGGGEPMSAGLDDAGQADGEEEGFDEEGKGL